MASTIDRALSTLGAVTPNTRRKAEMIWLACHLALGRAPGVLWGFDPNPANTEHHSRRAVDFMTTHHGWGNDRAVGDWIAQHCIDNAARYGVSHVIWRQRIYPAWGSLQAAHGGGWRLMEDRGSTTENHMDHPHVLFGRDTIAGTITPTATAAGTSTQEDDDMPRLTDKVRLANGETTYAEAIRLNDANQQRLIGDLVAVKETVDELLAREAEWAPVNFTAILRRLDELDAKIEKLGGAR